MGNIHYAIIGLLIIAIILSTIAIIKMNKIIKWIKEDK